MDESKKPDLRSRLLSIQSAATEFIEALKDEMPDGLECSLEWGVLEANISTTIRALDETQTEVARLSESEASWRETVRRLFVRICGSEDRGRWVSDIEVRVADLEDALDESAMIFSEILFNQPVGHGVEKARTSTCLCRWCKAHRFLDRAIAILKHRSPMRIV